MGTATTCAKVWLIILNSILVLCGVLLVAVGGIVGFGLDWLKAQLVNTNVSSYEGVLNYLPSEELRVLLKSSVAPNLGIGMFIVGLVMLVVSLVGCFGACKESRCMLIIYMVAVSVLLAVQLAFVIAFWSIQDKFLGALKPELQKSLKKYRSSSSDTKFWDTVQQVFQCCGIDDSADYVHLASPPPSCCVGSPCTVTHSGCLEKLKQSLEKSKTLVIAVSCTVMVIQLLVLIAAGLLSRGREKVDPNQD